MINKNTLKYPNFSNIEQFKESLLYGREIEILWNKTNYTIEYENNSLSDFSICEACAPETEKHFGSINELLNFSLKTGEKLKDIILKCEVQWRNL